MTQGAALRAIERAGVEAIVDPDILAGVGVDWTGRVRARPFALVRPASTAEIARLVLAAAELGVPLGIQGGRTSLVAGAVPPEGGIALSTERLSTIVEVDPASASMVVEAGVRLGDLAHAAQHVGLEPGIDLASRDSATVGGMIATNAGGERVVRYGTFGAQVLGLEAVLGTGDLLGDLARPPKNNVGPDLARLLVGAEGILGIVARARIALYPVPPTRVAVLAGFGSLADLIETWATSARALGPWIESAEFMRAHDLELGGMHPPVAGEALLLLGLRYEEDHPEALLDRLVGFDEAAVAIGDAERARLWRLRDELPLVAGRFGVVAKLDLGVWPSRLPLLASALEHTVARHRAIAAWTLFGHVPEGTAHLNIALEPGAPEDLIVAEILERTIELEGQIASEHGIGRAKRAWVRRARTSVELDLLAALKRTMDPAGVLNPGVLLPEATP